MLLTWPLAAALAAVVTALAGLVPPIALAVIAWVQTPDLGLWPVVGIGVRGWLLAHGAAVVTDSNRIGMVPLGVTAVCLLTGSGLAGMAAHRARAEADLELSPRTRRSVTLRVAGVFTLAYVVCVAVASALTDLTNQTGRALLGGLVVGGISGLVGAGRTLDWHPTMRWPGWVRAIPRGVLAGLSLMVATGALVAGIALVWHRDQVAQLHTMLAPTTAGSFVLLVLQLAWLPNVVLWCSSWALGAGFSIGTGTIVSPTHTLVSRLPAVPLFGAIGPSGAGPAVSELWMLSGVLAGVVAAVVVVRARPEHRIGRLDEDSLTGGLAGLLTGVALWLLCAASNGDLGSQRLLGVGARLVPLAVMAPALMAISGLLAGLVCSLLARRRTPAAAAGLEGVVEHPEDGTTRARPTVDQEPALSAMVATGAERTPPPVKEVVREDGHAQAAETDAELDRPRGTREAQAAVEDDQQQDDPRTEDPRAEDPRAEDPEEPTVLLSGRDGSPAASTDDSSAGAPVAGDHGQGAGEHDDEDSTATADAEDSTATVDEGTMADDEDDDSDGRAGAGERRLRGPLLRGRLPKGFGRRSARPKAAGGDGASTVEDEDEDDSGSTAAPR